METWDFYLSSYEPLLSPESKSYRASVSAPTLGSPMLCKCSVLGHIPTVTNSSLLSGFPTGLFTTSRI
jgi:hypothetical protein